MNIVRLFPVLFLWAVVLLTSVEVVCALEPVTNQSVEEGNAVINQGSSITGDHGTSSKDAWAGVLIVVLTISGILLLFALWTRSSEKQVRERTTELEATNKLLEFEIAGYKQAEDKLQKSESKYRTLLENLPQKIFLKDTHSSYISCNGNYARDLGIMPEGIVGKTDYDFFPGNSPTSTGAMTSVSWNQDKPRGWKNSTCRVGRRRRLPSSRFPSWTKGEQPWAYLAPFWTLRSRRRQSRNCRNTSRGSSHWPFS